MCRLFACQGTRSPARLDGSVGSSAREGFAHRLIDDFAVGPLESSLPARIKNKHFCFRKSILIDHNVTFYHLENIV